MSLLSVIIPVYNSTKFLPETINSVIANGYDDYEMLLVEDGSQDDSLLICHKFKEQYPNKITVLQHENGINKGVSKSRTFGVEHSTGEYVYFLDSDDILIPGILQKYVDTFTAFPSIALIHAKVLLKSDERDTPKFDRHFNLGETDRKYRLREEPYFLESNRICNSTVCVKKTYLQNIKFDFKQAFQVEDWLLWTLLSDAAEFYYLAEPAIHYRYHPDSATFKVVQNNVLQSYTILEYYLAVLAHTNNPETRIMTKRKLFTHLNKLYRLYSESNDATMNDLLDGGLLLGRVEQIEQQNKVLREEIFAMSSVRHLVKVLFQKFREK